MRTVALDTSALMAPVEVGVRLFDELDRLVGDAEVVVPRSVVDELSRLADGTGEAATAASVGLDLADRCRVLDAPAGTPEPAGGGREAPADPPETADEALVALAAAGALDYVVTADAALRDRLLATGVPVVGIRGRTALAITEP